MSNWYYSRNGQQLGPVPQAQLEQMMAQGAVTAGDLVWREGMAEWVPAGSVFAGRASPGYAAPPPYGAPPAQSTMPYYSPYAYGQPQHVFAGFWRRFAAVFVDGILERIVTTVTAVFFAVVCGADLTNVVTGRGVSSADLAASMLNSMVAFLIGASYEILMTWKWGATLGKMALGVKVVRADGSPLSFGRATGRYFAKILSALILCIGFIMAAFTARKQGLHDMMCDTVVVKT